MINMIVRSAVLGALPSLVFIRMFDLWHSTIWIIAIFVACTNIALTIALMIGVYCEVQNRNVGLIKPRQPVIPFIRKRA